MMDSSSKSLTQYIPSPMGSLSRLKQKGVDNFQKVKKSGKSIYNYNYSKFVPHPFSTIDESVKHSESGRYDDLEIIRPTKEKEGTSSVYKRNSGKSLNTESQFSLGDSDAATLVNSVATFKLNNASTSTSLVSSSSTVCSQAKSSLRSPTSRLNDTKIKEENNYISSVKDYCGPMRKSMVKTEILIEEPLNPTTDIKSFINSYNHGKAYSLGETQHLHYYQLPFPWRENRYIIHGYRFYNTHSKSLLSIFNWYGWHNETSNIWSHLLGAIYIIYLAIYDFPQSEVWRNSQVPPQARWIVFMFLAAALKCMLSSVFWHTFNGTSFLKLRSKFACVDYSGITILITASILTTEFVTMYSCYWAMCTYMSISLALGVFGVFMNWSPRFDRPEARPLRIRFFILLATMGVLSFLHLIFLTDLHYAATLFSPVTYKSVVWYLVGVVFYGSFIPERFRSDVQVDKTIPTNYELSTDLEIITKQREIHFREVPTAHSKCSSCPSHAKSFKSLWWVDYFGCSHTFWHFFVVLGVIGHYRAILDMFAKRWILS
ncbi:BTE_HP_G0165630.mRNA.1.CDS.1 [Saccharomyces cerevisiae]|nr:BTE_HP_G0050930.mRNA.1.CDS.1 [Saccharomyces cerevisiae]CAI5100607.1 BTE_HP_G0108970.mRNA.1.CDS.1 [Saccharomyces cerevisiae]CAI5132234.1 BTE_HP_G0119270.mRNA.1.CDS.1 [Saccharomyces cerevisiae]CAI5210959.1 BTE_HP_G0165630.mRNA.1.CDS.1 [Saccharomyces cerevisiae]CAI6865445.1 BTE_HP_G0050930.mRNA.1.CDS.1 [Saccharomyces cerevisiae]